MSKTNTVTAKVTSTPSTTLTKATPTVTQITTSTVSVSKTIASTKGTVTSTTTETATSTGTVTSFVTTGVTSTTDAGTTYTSTVPTPPGFVPVAQESGYVPKIKGRTPGAEVFEPLVRRQDPVDPSPSSYPTAVSCNMVNQVYSTTVTTVTAAKTKTVTETPAAQTTSKVVTKTTTITYDGRSTITQTATTTVPATTTEIGTTTTTNTVVLATPADFYVACDANNLVSRANGGHGITYSDYAYDFAYQQALIQPATAYECCSICQRTSGCQFSQWVGRSCVNVIRNTCHPGSAYQSRTDSTKFDKFYTVARQNDYPVTYSNGPCGIVLNGGDYQEQPPTAL
ncbi:hypothetical protein ACLMJK_006345 [Lecanora helva]